MKKSTCLKFCFSCFAALSCVSLMAGCKPEYYKKDADKEVYQIIDEKWDPNWGGQVNYEINDVPPDPNSLVITAPPVPGTLSLREAVALGVAQNREYQREKELLYLSALDLTLVRHQFDPIFFGRLTGSYNYDNETEFVDVTGEAGASKLFSNGAQVSTSIATQWLRFLTGSGQSSLSSLLSATATVPLLRGAGEAVVQEGLTQAERDTVYQIRSFNRFRKSFVVDIVSDYYRILQALDEVENARNNYENLQIAQERVGLMAETGRLPFFELDQARQDTLQAENNLVRSQEDYKRLLDQFKIRLALPPEYPITLDPNELAELGKSPLELPQISVEEAAAVALENRLDLANSQDRLEDAKRKIPVAENALQADLNLIGAARAPTDPPKEAQRFDFERGAYSLGFELDLPFDRKAERNFYRETLINYLQQQRQFQEDIDEVKFQVRQDLRDLNEAATSYKISWESLNLARLRVESTSILLEEGRATTRDMLDAQADLLDAQNATTAALVGYTLANLRFFRDMELLQVRPDGLWEMPQLAQADNSEPKAPLQER